MSYEKIINPDLQLSQDHDYGAIGLLSNDFLAAVAQGKLDIKALLAFELAARGYDAQGHWIGLTPKNNPVLALYSE